jgi:hypothetical protein
MSIVAISWSGGVPSTGLVAASIAGLLPRAEVVVFAETYSETVSTYRTLRLLKRLNLRQMALLMSTKCVAPLLSAKFGIADCAQKVLTSHILFLQVRD